MKLMASGRGAILSLRNEPRRRCLKTWGRIVSGLLGLALASGGTARAVIIQEAFIKADRYAAAQYSWEEFGTTVGFFGNTMVVGSRGEKSSTSGVNPVPNTNAFNAGAAFVFIRDEDGNWSQQAFIKASNSQAGDHFGDSVAISGDTIVVGAGDEDSNSVGVNSTPNEASSGAGAVYVFVRNGTSWTQQAYLKPLTALSSGAGFGKTVAIDGNTILVASEAASRTYVFVRNGTAWTQQAVLAPSPNSSDRGFGRALSIAGDTVAIGAPMSDNTASGINSTPTNQLDSYYGAAYVFKRSGTNWAQEALIKADYPSKQDHFGMAVALSGDTLAVGCVGDKHGPFLGPEYLRPGGSGTNLPPVTTTNGTGTVTNVSTPGSGGTGISYWSSGAVYMFTRAGTNWSQQAFIKASTVSRSGFGAPIALNGDKMVVAAADEDSDSSGIGGPQNYNLPASGGAYYFTRTGDTWTEQAFIKASNPGYNDFFGWGVGMVGSIVVLGSPYENSNSTGINSTPNDAGYPNGAVYVFDLGDNSASPVVDPPSGPAINQLALRLATDGTPVLTFRGTPFADYTLESTADLAPPAVWLPQDTKTADADGLVSFTPATTAPQGYYRTRLVQ